MVPECVPVQVPYTVCKMIPEERVHVENVTTCKTVVEYHTRCVPYVTCKMITQEVCQQVPQVVCDYEPYTVTVKRCRVIPVVIPNCEKPCCPTPCEKPCPAPCVPVLKPCSHSEWFARSIDRARNACN